MQEPRPERAKPGQRGWKREMDAKDIDDVASTEHGTYLDMGPLKMVLLKCSYHQHSP